MAMIVAMTMHLHPLVIPVQQGRLPNEKHWWPMLLAEHAWLQKHSTSGGRKRVANISFLQYLASPH